MAISEAPLKDLILMFVEDQNKAGGLLDRSLEPIVVDPGSNEKQYAEMARELITEHGVDVIFGCWVSSCRKAVLPVVEENDVLLYYPVQYEGQESSRNIFYFGAVPNQQAIPSVDYLMSEAGGGVKRWVLLGTDYVYPRTANTILRAYLKFLGVSDFDISEIYTPFGHSDWEQIVKDVRQFSTVGLKTAIVSTINGDANVHFFRELEAQGVDVGEIPVLSFSVGEGEIQQLGAELVAGNFAAWNYFMSLDTPENHDFVKRWREFSGDPQAVTNDPMEAHMIGFKMWTQSVQEAGSTATEEVRQAMYGQTVKNLAGSVAIMNGNHHISKPVLIGKARTDGQFDVVWSSDGVIEPDAWSDFILESAGLIADWRHPWVCGGCKTPKFGFPEE